MENRTSTYAMKGMRALMAFFVCLSFVFFMPHVAYLESAATNTVRVGVFDNRPNHMILENGIAKGIAVDYLDRVAGYTRWQYEYVPYKYMDDALTALQNGEIDMVSGMVYSEQRAANMVYSARPMGNLSALLCVSKDNDKYDRDYNNFSAFEHMKIGALNDYTVNALKSVFATHEVKPEIVMIRYLPDMKKAMADGTIDAMCIPTTLNTKEFKEIASFGTTDYYFVMNKERTDLKVQLDATMDNIADVYPYFVADLYRKNDTGMTLPYFTPLQKEYIEKNPVIAVAIRKDNYPLEYYDEKSGEFRGITVDFFNKISKMSGLHFFFVSSDQNVQGAEASDVKMFGSITNPDAGDGIILTDPAYTSTYSIIRREGYLPDYDNDVIGTLRDHPEDEQAVTDTGFKNVLPVYENADDALIALQKGDVAAVVLPTSLSNIMLKHTAYDDLYASRIPNSTINNYFAVVDGPDAHTLVRIINECLLHIDASESENIRMNYLLNTTVKKTFNDYWHDYSLLLISFTLLLTALMTSLFFYRQRREKKIIVREARERQHQNDLLQDALKRAEAASRAKTQFLSNISHDIRTPMNAITGYNAIAASHLDETDVVQECLKKSNLATEHLRNLINDVLDMSRIEACKESLNINKASLNEIIQAVCIMVQSQADIKSQHLYVNTSEMKNEQVYADAQKIRQILLNILGNAVKYTSEGGNIWLTVQQKESDNKGYAHYIFRIRDNGMGMSSDFIEHIFEAFEKEHTEEESGLQGTGLGMAIAKRLVDMMKGSISVESEQGNGSEFTIELDFRLQDDIDLKENAGISKVYDDFKNEVIGKFDGKRILLAEDNKMNREIATIQLEDMGFEVVSVVDGKKALEALEEAEDGYYDYVLMDMRMPVMDGLTATREIRSSDRKYLKEIPIIALTANAFAEDVANCLAAGMNAHVAKPFESENLGEILQKFSAGKLPATKK